MPNAEEIGQNLFDVKNAIAQQRLEGLKLSRKVVSVLIALRMARSSFSI